jgi:hypothetical protein
LTVDDEPPDQLRRLQAEDAVGDYTEGVGETDPTWAIERMAQAYTPDTTADQRSENGIDLGNVRGDDFRLLRRALGRLVRAGISDALPHVLKLVAYVPALTPWAIRYVIAAGSQEPDQAAAVLDDVVAKVSLSDWQRLWIVRALNELGALAQDAPGSPSIRVDWVASLRHGRHSPAVVAEATLAANSVQFEDLEYALRDQPGALTPWYLSAIRLLSDHGVVSDEQYAAVRGEGGLFAALLPRRSS